MPNDTWSAYWFRQCTSLEKITVKSISEVGQNAFNAVGAALQGDIVINEGATVVGDSAFNGCSSITSVSMPNTVTTIGGSAYRNCTNLKTAKLPEGIQTIGGRSVS